jgi:hypothetical protein
MTVWLKPNLRALGLGLILPAVLILLGAGLLALAPALAGRLAGSLLVALGAALALLLAWQMCLPRLAYEDGNLLVYLNGGRPTPVPLDIVECFLLGQAPTMLPGKRQEHAEASSVVIRLSERAEEWSHRDVKPALGKWCDGYITLRGTWCEPLNVTVVNRLNAQLAEATQSLKQAKVNG